MLRHLFILLALLIASPAMAGSKKYQKRAEAHVDMWVTVERSPVDGYRVTDGLNTLPGVQAYIRYNADDNGFTIYPQDRSADTIIVMPTEGHESEAIFYVLRANGFRLVAILTEDEATQEVVRSYAYLLEPYHNQQHCQTQFCDGTFTTVMMDWQNN
jgi:hypothetical protein